MPWLQTTNPTINSSESAILQNPNDVPLSEGFITSVDIIEKKDNLILCHISTEGNSKADHPDRDTYIKMFPLSSQITSGNYHYIAKA